MGKVISFHHQGDFKKTKGFLHGIEGMWYRMKLDHYAREGVTALREATPKDSGETASSWSYEIVEEDGRLALYWTNDHFEKGVNIAVILQYGHGTRGGGWVEGTDYINPAIRPIFDKIAKEAWKELIR